MPTKDPEIVLPTRAPAAPAAAEPVQTSAPEPPTAPVAAPPAE